MKLFMTSFINRILLALFLTSISFSLSKAQITSVIPITAPGSSLNANYMPLGTTWGFQRSQMQYSDAELSVAGFTSGGHWITQIGFYLQSISAQSSSTPVVILMKEKNGGSGLSSSLYQNAVSGYSQVFNGNINSSSWLSGTWVMITLNNPFYYNYTGTNNLEIIIETNLGGTGLGVSTNSLWSRTTIATPNTLQTWTSDGSPSTSLGILANDRPDLKLSFYHATACTAPGVITTVSSTASVCSSPAQQFTLSLSGLISPPFVPGGYTYVWQSGPTAGGPWTTLFPGPYVLSPTATAPTIVLTQSVTTYYHCQVTCGSSSISTGIQVGVSPCYCTPYTSLTSGTDIGQVVFGTFSNPSTIGSALNNPLAVNSFTDYTSIATPCYTSGVTYPFTVKHITNSSFLWSAIAHVFIDFDHDGILSSSEDFYLQGPTGPTGNSPTITSLTTNITIPFTAISGPTRMRVILRDTCCGSSGGPTNQACDNFTSGEIEDYTLCIQSGPACNVISVGTATATAPSVCTNQPFTLNLTGNVGYGSGMIFQWQSSITGAGGPYVDIVGVGANSFPFTIQNQIVATCYRLRVTCPANAGGAPQYPVPVCVGQNQPSLCVCTPIHPGCPSSPYISNVSLSGINNSTTCTNGNGAAYTIYPPAAGTTTTLTQGSSYNLTTTTQSGNSVVEVWIDFNADGVFSSSEATVVGTNISPGVATTVPIIIPLNATLGQCAMRVRTGLSGWPIDACNSMISGEAEDYIITIIAAAPTPCSALNSSGRSITSLQPYSNICSGTQITFSLAPSLTSPIVYSGLTYLWETAPVIGGPWGAASGLNTASTYTNIFSLNTFLRCTITCNAGGTYTTAAVSITTIPSTWLGFNDDWSDALNWCGRIPTLSDNVQINKTNALAIRGSGIYYSPVVAKGDTAMVFSLNISNLDSLTIISDTLVKVAINNDVINNGTINIISSAAGSKLIKIGNGTVSSPIFGQIFRGNQNDQLLQILYNSNELTALGLKGGNIIDSLLINFVKRSSGGSGFQNFNISYQQIPSSTLSSFSNSSPITGTFIPIYSTSALFTDNPTNGKWISNTHYFNGSTIGGSKIILGVSPSPNIAPNQLFIGDTIYMSSLLPYGIVTAVGSSTITVNIPANSKITNKPIQSKSIGGILSLSTNQNKFIWNGTDNIILQFCYNNNTSNANAIDEMQFTSTAPTNSLLYLSNGLSGASNDGCSLTLASPNLTSSFGQSPSSNRPNIAFKFRNPSKRLAITVGGKILNNGSAKISISSSDLIIGGDLINTGTLNHLDSSFIQIAGDISNSGLLNASNLSSSTTLNGTLTIGANVITSVIPNTNLINIGDIVSGVGIPSGTIVIAKTSTTITLNQFATLTGVGVAISFNKINNRPSIQFNGANWINNGTIIPGNGRVSFGSLTAQIIGGTNPSTFYDFNMQKTSNADVITLNNSISINDSLALRLGQLRMNAKSITVNNSNVSALSRQISGTATLTTTVSSATTNTVTPSSIAGLGIGDLIVNSNLSSTPIAHVVGINGTTVTYFPSASIVPVAGSVISFYKAGFLIGEDSLSKVNWLIDAVTGNRTIPFANITTNGAANPLHIPVNFNLSVTNAVDMDTVSFATYKAPFNLPLPPTVTHLNSAGPSNKTLVGNITLGSNVITGIASTVGVLVGDQVTGPGIPIPATVLLTTATTITLQVGQNAIATAPGTIFTTGSGVIAGNNNDSYTVDRFWILRKSSPKVLSIVANTTSGSTIITGVTNTTGIVVGQTIFGTGITNGTTVTSVLANTSVTMSLAATSTVTSNNIAFNYPLTALTFTLAYDERPCLNSVAPWTCADKTLNPLRPQPWLNQTIPTVQQTWKRLSFSVPVASPYTFSTYQNLSANLPNTNLSATVNNYPWIFGNYTPWAITPQAQPLGSQTSILTPIITSFLPTSAAATDTVKINGSNFNGAAIVTFGGINAASFNIISNNLIHAIVAGGASGYVKVTNSTGSDSLNGFTFLFPTASISGPSIGCINDTTVKINFAGNNGKAPFVFTYSINGGQPNTITTSSGKTASLSVPTNTLGIFNYSLISVSDSYNNSQLQVGNVIVSISPSAPLTPGYISGNARACSGDTGIVYSIASVNNATSYNWTLPIGATISSGTGTTSIKVDFNSLFNGGIIYVKAINSCGSSPSKTKNIAKNIPGYPAAITGPTYGVCSGSMATYSIPTLANTTTYLWTVPLGAIVNSGQGTTSINVSFPNNFISGTISVAGGTYCGYGIARSLSVRSIPTLPISISGPPAVCANQQGVAYSTSLISSATSYTWTTPVGVSIVSGQGTNSVVLNYGSTAGDLKVKGVNACGNGNNKILTVTIVCRDGETTLFENLTITIYPNPSNSSFTVKTPFTNDENYSIIINDVLGRKIEQFNNIPGNNSFEFGEKLLPGIYFIEIKSENYKTILKIIKSN